MSNYVMFFTEKEGTTALVSLLDNFQEIESISEELLEPFFSKPIPTKDLQKILSVLWAKKFDNDTFYKVYSPYSIRKFSSIQGDKPRGLKMRYYQRLKKDRWLERCLKTYTKMMIQTIKNTDVTVFFVVRQDLLRWALSKYHGDGTGRPGHLQFAVMTGAVNKKDIPRIYVSPRRLQFLIWKCKAIHLYRRLLYRRLRKAGIPIHILRYEDFIDDLPSFLQRFFNIIQVPVNQASIQNAIQVGTSYKKVHSDDISEFVINHEEIIQKFGNSFFAWPDE